jgi:hypothetical protein
VDEKFAESIPDDKFFRRRRTPLNINVIREHLRSASVDMQKMATVLSSAEAPRTVNPRTCAWCEHLKLCGAEMLGGNFVRSPEFNPEVYNLTTYQED